MEPSPIRNNGPYESRGAAEEQVKAATFGIPGSNQDKVVLLLREALMLTGVQISEFEESSINHISQFVHPISAQVIAGWIMRAYLSES